MSDFDKNAASELFVMPFADSGQWAMARKQHVKTCAAGRASLDRIDELEAVLGGIAVNECFCDAMVDIECDSCVARRALGKS